MGETGMRCRVCGYDLRDIESRKCPECGRVFHPDHPLSYLTAPLSGRVSLVLALIGAVLVAFPLVIAMIEDLDPGRAGPRGSVPVILLVPSMPLGLLFALFALKTAVPVTLGRRPWVRGRGEFVAALVIAGGIVLGWTGLMVARLAF